MAKNEPARSRAQAGQTQEQAAAVLGVSWRTWQDWERAVNAMPAYALRLYRHITGLERIPFRSTSK
jgi:DNA-binding XRE family transcriptional regulator